MCHRFFSIGSMWPAITLPYTYKYKLLFVTPLIPHKPALPSGISHSLAQAVHFILPFGSLTYSSASLPVISLRCTIYYGCNKHIKFVYTYMEKTFVINIKGSLYSSIK